MTTFPQTVFDQSHYLKLIEARGQTIKRVVNELKPILHLSSALDAGCGLGFFSQILRDVQLNVVAFDGRAQNVEEAKTRFPGISFHWGDIENPGIRSLGEFDLVLCFGLLYHLENPMLAIRNLRAMTRKGLLLESMCFPDAKPWMLLREEPSHEDQSLTTQAFCCSEGCLAKMLYRAGFSAIYRLRELPDHDDFRDTADHFCRRTVLFASLATLGLESLVFVPEPRESGDPWQKTPSVTRNFSKRVKDFWAKPVPQRIAAVRRRAKEILGRNSSLITLPFGARWIAEGSALDQDLIAGKFEVSETCFVERFLRPGMTVLDIGAHHGFYTLLASLRVGTRGRVFAFEPSHREQARLLRHLRINKCTNVVAERTALGAAAGEADLFLVDGAEDYCNSLRPPAVSAQTRKVRVPVETLDEFLDRKGLADIDFVKLDVEGAELDVLKGASNLLSRSQRPVLMVEVYDIRTAPWGYPAREIVQFLAEHRYGWFSLDAGGNPAPVDPGAPSFDANLVAVPLERLQWFTEFIQLRFG